MSDNPNSTTADRKDNVESMQQFLISSKSSIKAKFRQMIKNKVELNAKFGSGQSFNTSVIDVISDMDLIALDMSINDSLNNQFLESSRIVFKGAYDGIEIQFSAQSCTKAKLKNESVFAIPIPGELLWVQRREFYRVNIPLGIPAHCHISQNDDSTRSYRIVDISGGGISIHDEFGDLKLEPGEIITDCELELPEFGTGKVNLLYRNSFPFNASQPKLGNRLGFQFSDVGMSFAATIQRYIHSVETLRKRVED